jgi:diadenosine hexaphosphate hydrolase (ATP-forming)
MSVAEAGGIVVRVVEGTPRYLLVTAKDNPAAWIFPKGHIEPGEAPADAAVREVREEAGIESHVLMALGSLSFQRGGQTIAVQFFLLKYSGESATHEPRTIRWCLEEEALALLSFGETRALLGQSLPLIHEQLRRSP